MVPPAFSAAAPTAHLPLTGSAVSRSPGLLIGTTSTLRGPVCAPPRRMGVRALRSADDPQGEAERQGGRKGFYVRPSKALETGGGFYVPGVEGSRLRLGLAVASVVLLFVNRAISQGAEPEFSQVASPSKRASEIPSVRA
jgi:hypothetical protein